ncbi:hypothetical protein TIFTF001_031861 [Ficus carica]|uniref:Uncharacterized protein n=1 Tax=Ficus carica TaxID=3494 RepID=A0AA88DVU8_FICCA|nr:hypothetical protein TIFTF001_031861 [Ficus carica]
MLMSKIFSTTPDVIVRYDRPCTVTLHLITYEKEAPPSDMDTNEVSTNGTPMLKLVVVLVSKQRGRALARKNYPYLSGLANPVFIGVLRELGHRTSNRLAPRVPMAAEAGDRIGTVAGDVRRWMWSVVSRYCCQPVRGGMTRAVRDPHSRWCSTVVREMPSGPITRAPTSLRPG